MNISTASKKCGMSMRAIRDFEIIGFVKPVRMKNGARIYSKHDAEKLKFVKQALLAGFSIEECQDLLRLYFQHPENKRRELGSSGWRGINNEA